VINTDVLLTSTERQNQGTSTIWLQVIKYKN